MVFLADNMLVVENIDDLFQCPGICAGEWFCPPNTNTAVFSSGVQTAVFVFYFSVLVLESRDYKHGTVVARLKKALETRLD